MADDDLALRKATERAAQAQALLANDMLNEAFTGLRQAYIDAWLNTDARDEDGRRMAWHAVKNLDSVRRHLERVVSDGQIALKTIEFNEAKAQREQRA